MSTCTTQGVSHNDNSYFEKAKEGLKKINPIGNDGLYIYPTENLGNFLYGTSFSEHQAIKDVLYGSNTVFSPTYAEMFNNTISKLLREEGTSDLITKIRMSPGTISLNGKDVSPEKLKDSEILKYIAERYRNASMSHQGKELYTTHDPELDDLFYFLNDFYTNLESNKDIFTGAILGSSVIETQYTTKEDDSGSFTIKGINDRARTYLNEGMTGVLFDLMSPKEISILLTDPIEGAKIVHKLYRTSGTETRTIIKELKEYLTARRNTKVKAFHNEAPDSPKREILKKEAKELSLLKNDGGLLDSGWEMLVKGHIAHLSTIGILIDTRVLESEVSDENTDEDSNTRDSLGITPAHEVNPLTRMGKEVKILLGTLPVVEVHEDGTHSLGLNKLGVPRISNTSDIVSRLFKSLSNKSTPEMMMYEMETLAEEKPEYGILMERMGLDFAQWDFADRLSSEQMKIAVSFLTTFNNAKPLYQVMQLSGRKHRKQ